MGKLIVIEGTDCSGKQTQGKILVDNLNGKGLNAIYLSFPMYDTPSGHILGGPVLGKDEIGPCWFKEGIELDPYVACLYYAADRKYNISKVKDYLDQGYYVIVDRYTSSNMAHQGSKITNKDDRFYMFQWIDKLEYWLLDLPKPDMTIFLHMPILYSLELIKTRPDTDVAEKSEEHLKNAEETYLELAELYHWVKIECVKDNNLRTKNEIANEILEIIL
ncbi:MAG: hypothetical protein RR047_02490 [Bacilli bacterium]